MAVIQIPNLPPAISIDGAELVEIVQGGVTRRCTTAQISQLNVTIYSGSGDPNGVVSAPIGSLYTSYTGGAGSTLYVKESGGNGNTGWSSK